MNTIFHILITATWQSIVLAALVLLIVFLFRERLAPRFRYLLWCVVLLRLALPILPASPWGVLPGQDHGGVAAHTGITRPIASQGDAANGGHGKGEIDPQHMTALPSMSDSSILDPSLTNSSLSNPVLYDALRENSIAEAPVTDESHTATTLFATVKMSILTIWLLGVIALGVRYVSDEIRLYRQSRYWKPVQDAKLSAIFDSCRRQLGIRRRVALLTVSHGIGAASMGTLRPTVLLSEQAVLHSDADQLRMVLLHELVHLRRFDPLVLRLALILNVIHWLNPVAWLVMSRLQRDRELACDAAVLHILESNISHRDTKITKKFKNQDLCVPCASVRNKKTMISHRGTKITKEPENRDICVLCVSAQNDLNPLELTQKAYGEAVLAFATRFSPRERLPGLVGLFQKNAIARRIDMILNYKKTNLLYALFGVVLVVAVAAIGLTRQMPKIDTPVVVDEIVSDESDMTIDSSIENGFATASAMPETTDKERVAKYDAFYFLMYSPKNSATNDKIRNEQLRIAQIIEQKGIRAAKLSKVAREYADEGKWTKYMEIVDSLQPPFRELGISYYHACQDMKNGNKESAMKRFQDYENQIKQMPEGFEQGAASLICFISLGKLGFTDEIVQYVNETFKTDGHVGFDHDAETKHGFYVHNEFTDAIVETANYLIKNGEKDKAFDLALGLYTINNGNPGHIMNRVIEVDVKEDQIDKAMELTQKIKTTLGRETQWETYCIFQALLKKNEFDRALGIAKEVTSFNALVQKQMYFELMEYLLNKGEKDKCAVMLDEALEKSAAQSKSSDCLVSLALFMKIAVKLDDSKKVELVMSESQNHLDRIMGNEWKQGEYPDERQRVHSLCEFATVQAVAGKIDEAKVTFRLAIQQTEKVDEKWQADYALYGVACSQAGIGFVEDTFETVKLISDKVIETEAYRSIGNSFLSTGDISNAKRALAEAQKGLEIINDSRVFGLVNWLERLITEAEE